MRLALCAITLSLLVGCGTSALRGLSPVAVESKHTLNTLQTCVRGPELLRVLDLAVPLVAEELTRAGLVPDRVQLGRIMREPLALACVVEQPEPCVWVGAKCASSTDPVCARKRGCASYAHLWVARWWPPVCTTNWPTEPHCVSSETQQNDAGWKADVFHEVAEMICARLGTCKPHEEPAAGAVTRAFAVYTKMRETP